MVAVTWKRISIWILLRKRLSVAFGKAHWIIKAVRLFPHTPGYDRTRMALTILRSRIYVYRSCEWLSLEASGQDQDWYDTVLSLRIVDLSIF